MKSEIFIPDDFLLQSDIARELYHDYAKPMPIFDYHTHLSPAAIAQNKAFSNLTEIWLAGDHYKWRAMRAAGVPEAYCTGAASDWEKFLAFARIAPRTLRNPLYHWTHLELKRYFGIDKRLDESTAREIWDEANQQLQSMPVWRILERQRVAVVCTTDDPADRLEHHCALQGSQGLRARVYPTFRPDRALALDRRWLETIGMPTTLPAFLDALVRQMDFFHAQGCRLSDHGLRCCPAACCTEAEAARIYEGNRGDALDEFRGFLLRWLGEQYHARGWVMQLHIGPLRNNNTRMMQRLGSDAGFDSIGDCPQAESLARFLDQLDQNDRLPKTILYNANPADNYVFGSMIGNFQDGRIAGKIQLGSGWWFLDQREGIEWQLNALSNLGLLSDFVGFPADSRSFLSFSRHEYFRRILCDLIGRDVVRGEAPRDMKLLGGLVQDICYHNARRYFDVAVPPFEQEGVP